MAMLEEDDDEFDAKLLDTKEYIRETADGDIQLVQLVPRMSGEGGLCILMPEDYDVYVDEKGPIVMSREAAENMVEAYNCVPLEIVAQYKNYWIN